MNRSDLLDLYWKMEKLIVPGLKYSQAIYEEELDRQVTPDTVWVDLGCGHQLLSPWRKEQEIQLINRCRHIVGVDGDMPSLQAHQTIKDKVCSDISNKLPFDDETFDLATSNMVLEHLSDPLAHFLEVKRVLKKNGVYLFHTPNVISLFGLTEKILPEKMKTKFVNLFENRKEHDVFPAYYQVNTTQSITQVTHDAGMIVDRIRLIASSAKFALVPPIAFFELLLTRLLMTDVFSKYRPNIIAIVRK
jgi:SAM-dependent methyltransferase